MNNSKKRKPWIKRHCTFEIGFVLVVFGVISVCAFFLPPKAWILLLGAVLIISGILLITD